MLNLPTVKTPELTCYEFSLFSYEGKILRFCFCLNCASRRWEIAHTHIVDEKKLEPYSEDEKKLEGQKKLVLRISRTEYGTCVFEDAKVNFDAAPVVTMVELHHHRHQADVVVAF